MPNPALHVTFLNAIAAGDMDAAKAAYDAAILAGESLDALSDKSSAFSNHIRLTEIERKKPELHAVQRADHIFSVINTPEVLSFSTTVSSELITVTGGNTIVIPENGDYYIEVTPQLDSVGGVNKKLSIWLTLNGTAVPDSLRFATDDNNEGNTICIRIPLKELVADNQIQILAEVNGLDMELRYTAPSGVKPAGSSLAVIIKRTY